MSGTIDLIDPSNAAVFDRVSTASKADLEAAIRGAAAAQFGWSRQEPSHRAASLRRLAQLIDADLDHLCALETQNAGVLTRAVEWGVHHVRDALLYAAGGVERLIGKQIPVAGGLDVTFYEPVGIVGLIAPWNFPLVVAGRGMAAPLAAGNAVIIKPSELTPLTALRLAELAVAAGLPEGLVQTVVGTGPTIGNDLVEHPDVGGIAFTGSTAVGQQIVRSSSQYLKRLSLELGGKSANLIFADADLKTAAQRIPESVFDLAGQDCCARSRLLVERSALDEVMSHLEPVIKGLTVGHPADPATDIGPLISQTQLDKVASFLDGDVEVAIQGTAPFGSGYWFPPTVLAPSGGASRAAQEEIFGPILTVIPFEDEAAALRIANSSRYGLAGSVWTNDLGRAIRVSRGLQAGNVSVNSHSSVRYITPFGGYKQSGLGRNLGPEALETFTETKNVFFSSEL